MKLGAKKMLLISFMLFSLFFGAGNLIFPPYLGQSAGKMTPVAFIGFCLTAVVLPVLGVIVVAKFNGLQNLGNLVGKKFAIVFAVVIYLSIGPGLGIPRAGSLPFEMAVNPFLSAELQQYENWFMALYSFIFFAVALWLCFTPGKLVKRIGTVLTPSLLILLIMLFISFLIKGETGVKEPFGSYESGAFLKGFTEGYMTMDAIAALNFGLVIATTLTSFGVKEKKSIMRHTVVAGIIAGSILMFVYFMLAYIGAESSGVYPVVIDPLTGKLNFENGAPLLRNVVTQLFGMPGAILLAAIFTLACLTTCVGLINSISSYFSTLFTKVSYRKWVIIITVVSFLVCNLGLDLLLQISVPVLDIVYPISIALIFFGFTNKLWDRYKAVYKTTITATAIVSLFSAIVTILRKTNVEMAGFEAFLANVPLFNLGFFWVLVDIAVIAVTMLVYLIRNLYWKKKGIMPLGDAVCADNVAVDATNETADENAVETPCCDAVDNACCDAVDAPHEETDNN